MAEIVFSTGFVDFLKGKIVLLDTCVIIELTRCPELVDLLSQWRDDGIVLMILVDTYVEFMRGAKTRHEYERSKKLIEDLSIQMLYGVDLLHLTKTGTDYQIMFNNVKDSEMKQRRTIIKNGAPEYKPSVIDERLLFIASNRFGEKTIVLLTENYTDVPLCLFDNRGTVVVSDFAGMRTIGSYIINENKLSAALSKIK